MIEAIKLVGSIVGLVTGAFVLSDRPLKGRPLVFIAYNDAHRQLVLRAKNVSAVDILILGVRGQKFDSEAIRVMGLAFESARIALDVVDRDDHFSQVIAERNHRARAKGRARS